MRTTIKHLTFIAMFFYLSVTPALAESEYVEDWIGTWTVTMKDETTVLWDISHTWVSDTGKSHLAYGTTKPDNVEFQIVFNTMFMQYFYLEISHDVTVYDFPMDFSQYSELVPDDDFETFTANEGNYPIQSGYRGTVAPEPDICAASYLLGADDPRLNILRQFRDEHMATSIAGNNMIEMYYAASDDIISVCEINPTVKLFLKQMLETILTF